MGGGVASPPAHWCPDISRAASKGEPYVLVSLPPILRTVGGILRRYCGCSCKRKRGRLTNRTALEIGAGRNFGTAYLHGAETERGFSFAGRAFYNLQIAVPIRVRTLKGSGGSTPCCRRFASGRQHTRAATARNRRREASTARSASTGTLQRPHSDRHRKTPAGGTLPRRARLFADYYPIRPGRSGPGSSPWSTRRRSPARTFRETLQTRRLPQWLAVRSSSRR